MADFDFCWSALLLSEIHIALQFTETADLEFHWSALLLSEIYMAWHFTKISHFHFRDRLFLTEIRIFMILWRLIVWVLRSRNVWHKIGWFWNFVDRLLNRFCFLFLCFLYLFIYLFRCHPPNATLPRWSGSGADLPDALQGGLHLSADDLSCPMLLLLLLLLMMATVMVVAVVTMMMMMMMMMMMVGTRFSKAWYHQARSCKTLKLGTIRREAAKPYGTLVALQRVFELIVFCAPEH